MNDFPSITDHVVVWIFGIIFPFLSGLQSEKLNGEILFNADTRKKLYLGNSLMLSISGLSILGIWYIKKRSFDSLGFRSIEHFTTLLILPLVLFISFYAIDLLNTKKQLTSAADNKDAEWFEKSSAYQPFTSVIGLSLLWLVITAPVAYSGAYYGFTSEKIVPPCKVSSVRRLIPQ